MGPVPPRVQVVKIWLPRASGDGPQRRGDSDRSMTVAPRERGWALLQQQPHHLRRGCPARAGMGPRWTSRCWRSAWLPRASGDGPFTLARRLGLDLVAPRERGWAHHCRTRTRNSNGCDRLPVVRQQFVDPAGRLRWQPLEHVAHVRVGVVPVEPAECIRLMTAAARLPARRLPANSQFAARARSAGSGSPPSCCRSANRRRRGSA
jgi:hypothetical protein